MTQSDVSRRLVMRLCIVAEPSNSLGFGGMAPAGITHRFSNPEGC